MFSYVRAQFVHEFFVLKNNAKPILGLITCEKLGIIKRINSIENLKERFIADSKNVFESIGTFEEMPHPTPGIRPGPRAASRP